MVCDISSPEAQLALCISTLGVYLRNLGVLDDSICTITYSYHTNGFSWIGLANDLGRAFSILGDAVPDEGGISYADKAVVNTVGVEILDLVRREIV